MLSLRDSCFSYNHGKFIERGALWRSKLFDDKKNLLVVGKLMPRFGVNAPSIFWVVLNVSSG
jgi:hypothetical protein